MHKKYSFKNDFMPLCIPNQSKRNYYLKQNIYEFVRKATFSIGFWQKYQILNRELLETKERWKNNLPPLMIVLGDHGMADAGGHGGSSPAEVMTPMIFISPKVIY